MFLIAVAGSAETAVDGDMTTERTHRAGTVLFVASQPFFQWRGSPIRVGFNVLALAESGFEVDLLTLPVGDERAIPGVRVVRAPNPFRVKNVSIGPSLVKLGFDGLLLREGFRLIRQRRYDVIHCVEDAGLVGVPLARRAGARLVFEKHSDPRSYRAGLVRNLILRLYAHAEAFVIRRADAVIGTGPGLVRQITAVHPGARAHHIFDIPSSLVEPDEASATAARARFCEGPEDVLIGFVGSFAVYQGVDLLFAAIPEVLADCAHARFLIIGGTAEEIAQRRTDLAGRPGSERVRFAGKIPPDDLPHVLAACDVLLSPRGAGVNTPLKLLDYLKAGRAIVATDTEANRLILDESTAVLVQPDPGEFARAICALVRDPARRAMLGRSGRRLIDARYNFNEFKRRLADCYAELLPPSLAPATRHATRDTPSLIADTHVHLYECYDLDRALAGLADRLRELDPDACRAGFLAERTDCDFFARLWARAGERVGRFWVERGPEEDVLLLAEDGKTPLYLFAGRQVVTRERIEVLALATRGPFSDGRPVRETLKEIRDAGGVPVLSWAPGKWFFGRGRVISALIEEGEPGRFLLGDTTLRPAGWPEPRLMGRAAGRGFGIVAGSDPLPFAGEERILGAYAARLSGRFDPAAPVASVRRILLQCPLLTERKGRRGRPAEVIRRLRRNAAAAKEAREASDVRTT